MLILRSVLIIVFGLLFIGVLSGAIQNSDPAKETDLGILAFFALVIAVLGPFWPSKQKLENSAFTLPTDNPKLAKFLLGLGATLISFYFALKEWLSPSQSHGPLTKTVHSLLGDTGVATFWLIIGIFCLIGAYTSYKKYKTA